MIKAIIFDLDGTLLDTLDDILDSVNYALSAHQLKLVSKKQVRQSLGYGSKYLISNVIPKEAYPNMEKILETYQAYYNEHNRIKTKAYPKINEVLKALKHQGLKLAVVSNKYDHMVKKLNTELFEGLFDVSIGEIKGIPNKPAPDMLYLALDALGLEASEVFYVGDSEVDILTAKNAKVEVIAVTWGFRDKEVIKAKKPEYIIESPLELLKIKKTSE